MSIFSVFTLQLMKEIFSLVKYWKEEILAGHFWQVQPHISHSEVFQQQLTQFATQINLRNKKTKTILFTPRKQTLRAKLISRKFIYANCRSWFNQLTCCVWTSNEQLLFQRAIEFDYLFFEKAEAFVYSRH
jgi:hypothetical protein